MQTGGVLPNGGRLGEYDLLAKLGEGGMGAVFKAEHRRLKRLTAVKVIAAHSMADPALLARFQREMQAVARLDHANIVRAYDAGEDAGIHFLAMEYLEGTDLAAELRRRGRFAADEACRILVQAARGLQHAHDHHLVHRDLKPSNLFLARRAGQRGAVVKILDLGLARFQDGSGGELTRSDQAFGSFDYMAPEQFHQASKVDIRADIYSLGCTLYQLLAGHVPFPDTTVKEKAICHAIHQPAALSGLRPDLPPPLIEVVERMMAKTPAERYATPAEMAEALLPFSKTKASPEAPAGPVIPAPPADAPVRETVFEAPALQPPLSGAATAIDQHADLEAAVNLFQSPLSGAATAIDQHPRSPRGIGSQVWLRRRVIVSAALLAALAFAVASIWPKGETKPLDAKQARASQEASAKELGVPVEITNTIGMKLILIPAGEFTMGSPNSDADAFDREKPQHKVRITRPFYLGMYEVTQHEWETVMGTTPWRGKGGVREGENFPATHVPYEDKETHDDALEFCRRLSQREGKTYRLPTEAEWEYACRAGMPTKFSFGDDESRLGGYAWFEGNAWGVGEQYAHEVGLKKPNTWGLYDMHGNVWEWCSDWYDESYYASLPALAEDPKGPTGGSSRVPRGGSWNFAPPYARSAFRHYYAAAYRYHYSGFRVACSPR